MKNNMTLALALGAGLMGGMLSRYITPPTVSAQKQSPQEVRAQSFVLVDQGDYVVGTFMTEVIGGARTGMNPDGIARTDIALPRRMVLRNSSGRVLWSTDSRVIPLRTE